MTAQAQQRFDIYQSITDHIVTAIEHGAGEFHFPWIRRTSNAFARPINIASAKPYNGINIVAPQEDAVEIGGMNGPPIRERGMLGVVRCGTRFKARDPCIVYQHVEPAEPVKDRRLRGAPLIFVTDIKGKRNGLAAQLARHAFRTCAIQVADHHASSFAGE